MKKEMFHIGDILNGALKEFRPSADTGMTRIWDIWDQAVGEATSRNAKPGAFKDGILIVHVSSSVWMHHMLFIKQDMQLKINQTLGQDLVRELKFKIAALHP